MTFHVALNRSGRVCVVDAFGEHNAFPTRAEAEADCAKRNAAAEKARNQKAAREHAAELLGPLARRLRVGLLVMPQNAGSSAGLAGACGFVRA